VLHVAPFGRGRTGRCSRCASGTIRSGPFPIEYLWRDPVVALPETLTAECRPADPIDLVTAPPGTGKTYSVLTALADDGPRAVYAVPTHELAIQIQADLEALGASTHRWRRGPDDEDGCPHGELVAFFRTMGYMIRRGPCADCVQRRSCAYRRVFTCHANRTAQVLILTSWHLRRPDLWTLKALENRPLVVIDEDALSALAAPVELTIERLRGFVENLQALRNAAGEEGNESVPAMIDIFRRAAEDVLRCCATAAHGLWRPSAAVLERIIDADRAVLADEDAFFALVRLRLLKVTTADKKRRRRNLPDDEMAALVDAARRSPEPFMGLSGPDRAMLYIVAAKTGLRASELASLTPKSFSLDGPRATVRCLAGYTKNGEEAVLPLRSEVAAMVREWLAGKPVDRRLWPGEWASQRHGAEMIRVDPASPRLRRAGLTAADVDYEDETGRVADFHALRHTFISNLARAGVHPRNAQALARHSTIDLTMNVYTHVGMDDLHDDVEAREG